MIVDVLKRTQMMNEPLPDEKCPPAPCCTEQNSQHWHFAIAPSVVAFHCWPGRPRWPEARTSLKARQHESGYRGEAPALYSEAPVSSLRL